MKYKARGDIDRLAAKAKYAYISEGQEKEWWISDYMFRNRATSDQGIVAWNRLMEVEAERRRIEVQGFIEAL